LIILIAKHRYHFIAHFYKTWLAIFKKLYRLVKARPDPERIFLTGCC
jgi:hypothetical protein